MNKFVNGGHNEFCVTVEEPVIVFPAEETPKEVLYLTNIDDQPLLQVTLETLHVYTAAPNVSGADPAEVIRNAVSKALVYYYPLAGRMRKTRSGKLEVNCTGEGAVFVEANANCSVEKAGYMAQITPSLKQLLYQFPLNYDHHEIPPLVVQVTHFLCGGFSVALCVSHCIIDGVGHSQFLKAMAELARGMPSPSVIPVWKRELLSPRNPPQINFLFSQITDTPLNNASSKIADKYQCSIQGSFIIAAKSIAKLKQEILAETKDQLQYCSTFEALAAFIWKSRVKALKFPLDEQVQLTFAINARKLLNPPLPEGYYGNGIMGCSISLTAKELYNNSLWYLVKNIKEKKCELTDEYIRSNIDFLEVNRGKEVVMQGPLPTTHMYLTDWTRMEYGKTDFGWGEAKNVTPPSLDNLSHLCVLLPPPIVNGKDKNNVRLLTCLPTEAMETFKSEMQKLCF